ncbi:hypothetical protein BCV70DRAFT_196719 [Testicularia cyperi]|uniref:Uncharacterized protein n=1 Tax=Testicularia cyperi TaxID=1882483 RepID=A0A317XW41_9BASI|nr:hypothetical protein BCV70DRAFT_196719 [Testicularia cyperi]
MSASRRAQIQALCGMRSGPLIDRVESYLAAVDLWSRRGNAKAVKNAGTGVVAVCCFLAAESLETAVPDRSTALRSSGLAPEKFAAAERDFRGAVNSVSSGSSQSLSGPSQAATEAFSASLRGPTAQTTASATHRPVRSSPLVASASPSTSSHANASSADSKQALLAKAQAAQAGTLFDQTLRSSAPILTATVSSSGSPSAPHGSAASRTDPTSDAGPQTRAVGPANAIVGDTTEPMLVQVSQNRKRKRMSRLVFGLAVQSSLGRLDKEQEAEDVRLRRVKLNHLQTTINNLQAREASFSYLEPPGDFFVAISPSNTDA